jgi:thymidine kinase
VETPGTLHVVVGPMFSGKTDELIDRYEAARDGDASILAVKPARDSRHPSDRIVSHSGREMPAQSVTSAAELRTGAPASGLVLIDEIQFFEPSLAETIRELRARGLNVVAVGLDLDFRGEEFETTALLAQDATQVVRLVGRCSRCGNDAVRTQRLIDGRPAPLDAPRFVVGDAELYEPRCEVCWHEERDAAAEAAGHVIRRGL